MNDLELDEWVKDRFEILFAGLTGGALVEAKRSLNASLERA